MGTSPFAQRILEELTGCEEHTVAAVVTQTDKKTGRGMKVVPQPIKTFAEEHGIPVFQPETLRNFAFRDELGSISPDIIVVAAYGKILPDYVIDYPEHGCVNVHASLLPKYRGAAPINRAIMDGEEKTGVSIMKMDYGLDTGDVYATDSVEIGDGTFLEIHDRLADMGAVLLVRVLSEIENGTAAAVAQPAEGASYAAKIEKEDCVIDFSAKAENIVNRIRGLSPVPSAFAYLAHDGKTSMVKFINCTCGAADSSAAPGTVISLKSGGILVAAGEGTVLITSVKPEGKGIMSASDLINGRKISEGDTFSSSAG